jgi:hypothetical protein
MANRCKKIIKAGLIFARQKRPLKDLQPIPCSVDLPLEERYQNKDKQDG